MEMELSKQLFIVFIVSGTVLVGAELFVPGGILGSLAAILLFAAVITAFKAFGPQLGLVWAFAVLVLAGASFVAWIRIFPSTRLGKKMAIAEDLSGATSAQTGLKELLEKEGEALSNLRPAGYARINGQRIDVVTQGQMIPQGARIKVVEVEGNRVIVAKV